MVKIVQMDERITLDKQLEENIGPVILKQDRFYQ